MKFKYLIPFFIFLGCSPATFNKTNDYNSKKSFSSQGFAYIFEGDGDFHNASNPVGIKVEKEFNGQEFELRDLSGNRTLVVFDNGDEVAVQAGEKGIRFLLISGTPIKEPVAWHGPIVMNTQEELKAAFNELNNGTFIK